MKALKTKSTFITHCDKCNCDIKDVNYVFPITEVMYGEIIGLMVCDDCNEQHQRELEWNVQRQLND